MKETEQMIAIQMVLDGKTETFTKLVDHFQGSVMRMALAITGDSESAQDIAQDAFVSAFQNLVKYDADRARFSAWLYTIVRNRSRNFLRQRKKKQTSSIDQSDWECSALGPDNKLNWKEQYAALDQALMELPDSWRRAFSLAEIDGVSYADVAVIEGIPIGTVRSRVSRSRKFLAKKLTNPFKINE